METAESEPGTDLARRCAELEALLAREREQQRGTAAVLALLERSPVEVQRVLDTIVATAARLCNAEFAFVFLRRGARLELASASDANDAFVRFTRDNPLPVGKGSVTGLAASEGRTVHIADFTTAPEFSAAREYQRIGGHRTILGVPLLRDGAAIGSLTLMRAEVAPFATEEIALVETFAAQAVVAIENSRLFEAERERAAELTHALKQQAATAEVLKTISRSALDLQTVLDVLTASSVALCDADLMAILRREGDAFRYVTNHGIPAEHYEVLVGTAHRPGCGSLVGMVLESRSTVHLPDVLAEPRYSFTHIQRLLGFRSMLGVPMLRDGEVIGVLNLMRKSVRPFAPDEIRLVETFADQAVIAINNAELFASVQQRTRELQQALDHQTATGEVLGVISRTTDDLQPVLDTIVATSCRLCKAGWAVIFRLLDDGHLHCVAGSGGTKDFLDYVASRPRPVDRGSLVGRAALEARPVHVADVLEDPEYTWLDAQRAGGYRTALAVPLVRGGTVLGVLALQRNAVEPFSAVEIEAVTTFADQAVIAIGNVGLFQEVQNRTRELQTALDDQTATSEVLSVISRSPSRAQEVLETIVGTFGRLCHADFAFVFMRKDDGLYHVEAVHPANTQYLAFLRANPVRADRGTTTGRTVVERRTIHIPDATADPDYAWTAWTDISGSRTVLGVPLLRDGEPVGVVAASRARVDPFSEREIRLIETFADQAIIAIENARLFGELEARTRELAASLENLRTTQDRLVQTEKLASLGQLTAGIAHEIKNPLNFVNNFAKLSDELLGELAEILEGPMAGLDAAVRDEADELFAMVRENLAKIAHHGGRADSIVKNMLRHARHGSAEWRMADVNALVEDALNLAYHGARAEHPDFTVEIARSLDPALGQIECCPQDLTRVILNLVSNGIYAANRRRADAPAGFAPRLDVATRTTADGVEIEVRDNGAGIPPEIRDRIFLPFFTTKPAGEGTGLGLSISHDIVVEQHGGAFAVESEPGSFTLFRVALPRAAGHGRAGP